MSTQQEAPQDKTDLLENLKNPSAHDKARVTGILRADLSHLESTEDTEQPLPKILQTFSAGYGNSTQQHGQKESLDLVFAFDTNVYKGLMKPQASVRMELDSLARFKQELEKYGLWIHFLVPGQSYIEFFTNVEKLGGDLSPEAQRDLKKLKDALNTARSGSLAEYELLDEDLLSEMIKEVQDSTDNLSRINVNDIMQRATELWTFLFEDCKSLLVTAPRDKLHDVARVRASGKFPPGWMDVDSKSLTGFGDFYLWADTLLGLATLSRPTDRDSQQTFVLVTNDGTAKDKGGQFKKLDWGPAGSLHPVLVAECKELTGFDAFKITSDDFKKVASFLSNIDPKNP